MGIEQGNGKGTGNETSSSTHEDPLMNRKDWFLLSIGVAYGIDNIRLCFGVVLMWILAVCVDAMHTEFKKIREG